MARRDEDKISRPRAEAIAFLEPYSMLDADKSQGSGYRVEGDDKDSTFCRGECQNEYQTFPAHLFQAAAERSRAFRQRPQDVPQDVDGERELQESVREAPHGLDGFLRQSAVTMGFRAGTMWQTSKRGQRREPYLYRRRHIRKMHATTILHHSVVSAALGPTPTR